MLAGQSGAIMDFTLLFRRERSPDDDARVAAGERTINGLSLAVSFAWPKSNNNDQRDEKSLGILIFASLR